MDPSRGSKRSSISFGSYQRQPPGQSLSGNYDNSMFSYGSFAAGGSLSGSGAGSASNSSSGGNYYANISPMYSPLDYSQPIFSPNGYPHLSQYRNTNASPVVCEYEANYPLFAVDWNLEDYVGLGSYLEGSKNRLQIIKSNDLLTWDKIAECNVTFPVSNIQWHPGRTNLKKFATCSDSLRIWNLNEEENTIQEQINLSLCKYNKQQNVNTSGAASTKSKTLNNNATFDDCQGTAAGHPSLLGELPPITSFHWNPIDTNLLISCSIDTTCIVWDLQSNTYVKTQLIAHDSEVFDVRFLTQSTQLFASCGGDGSVRVFDLRCLAHSTIIYEPNLPVNSTQSTNNMDSSAALSSSPAASLPPYEDNTDSDFEQTSKALLRLEPSPFDPNVIATFGIDSNSVLILDMRNPGSPVLKLQGHNASVNQIKWHPTRRNVIISCSDDCQVLLWDLTKYIDGQAILNEASPLSSTVEDPSKSSYRTSGSVSEGNLSATNSDPAVSKWNPKNESQALKTPTMYYANKGEEINNIVWRPQIGDWFGSISGKKLQNIKV